MFVKDLRPNPENPRTISPEKLDFLKNSLAEYGDLSGIIFNRKTKRLVGGHQRLELFDQKTKIFLENKYPKKTKVGTVAEGYVLLNGERFSYREVEWDSTKEKAANIAANKGAGEWDFEKLSIWVKEIEEKGFNLDLTMFDEQERIQFLAEAEFNPGKESDQGRLDKKKPIECPHCGMEFVPE